MLDLQRGSGGGGHFVGLHPDNARALVRHMTTRGSEAVCTARRIDGLLAEEGDEAGAYARPGVLRSMDSWLCRTADDLRWRIELVAGDAAGGGMRFATLTFASAAAAEVDGRRYAGQIAAALRRYFDADDAESLHTVARRLHTRADRAPRRGPTHRGGRSRRGRARAARPCGHRKQGAVT